MRPDPPLVGRDREVAVLEEVLSEAAGAAGTSVLVTGEAGIGKSRIAREASARARGLGFVVLTGRAVEGGSHIPFRPVAEALAASVRHDGVPDSPLLRPYRRLLAKLSPDWGESDAVRASPVAVSEAVLRLLIVLADPSGLMLVLEDLHWADEDTLALVDYLADHVGGERVVVLATIRSDEAGSGRALADVLTSRRAALHIPLGRLTREDVSAMVGASIADPIYDRSQGVPFLVEEFATSYAEGTSMTPPASYRELIRTRASRLDEAARLVVQAASALGSSIDWSYLPAAAECDPDAVARALKQAVEVSLLVETSDGQIEFRHALIPETILTELATPQRLALLARAAAVIEEVHPGLPGEWCEHAADLLARSGDRSRAAELLLESGRRALKRGAAATAERTLEHARTLVEGDRWRTAGIDRVLVQALGLQGKVDRMCELGQAALAFMGARPALMGTPERLGEVHIRIAEGLIGSERWAEAKAHVERAAALADEASDADLSARVLASRVDLALEDGDAPGARSAADELRTLPADHRIEFARLRADGRIALAVGAIDEAADLFGRALQVADRADLTVARVRTLIHLAEIDELTTGSRAAIERAGELTARAESLVLQVEVRMQSAALHLSRHELEDADADLHDARAICEAFRVSTPVMLDLLDAELCALRRDKKAAKARAGRAAAGDPRHGAAARAVRALAYLAHDEIRQANEVVAGETLPSRWRWLNDVLDDGREPQEAFPWRHHYFHRIAVPVDPAALQRSLAFFEANGYPRIAAACRGLLTRAGVRVRRRRGDSDVPRALSELGITGREADVLRHVSDGSTNREIAEALFLSPRTVETHVAGLMRKTGAKSRAGLAAYARTAEQD